VSGPVFHADYRPVGLAIKHENQLVLPENSTIVDGLGRLQQLSALGSLLDRYLRRNRRRDSGRLDRADPNCHELAF
jgi:hypothetical protein